MNVQASIQALFRFSPFIENSCQQDEGLLAWLEKSGRLQSVTDESSYRKLLNARLKKVKNDQQLSIALRQFRRQEMVRIAARDLAGWG
ncbi:MAG: bifunctional glutamine synthetase adenylyltransferase/deadenyltransferase, partial [Gammaproteobacteria bacterium]|nr:bifunctional glutamine synthetase adenylyltransferase/deadenyltransferase [Gammaproteobacteria bacterium]